MHRARFWKLAFNIGYFLQCSWQIDNTLAGFLNLWYFYDFTRLYLELLTQKTFTSSKPTKETLCSRLTIKTPKRRHWRSNVLIVNFELISHLFPNVSIVENVWWEQVNVWWEPTNIHRFPTKIPDKMFLGVNFASCKLSLPMHWHVIDWVNEHL